MKDQIGHISTGGGAFLQMLGGKAMPGIEAYRIEREAGPNRPLLCFWPLPPRGRQGSFLLIHPFIYLSI